MSATATFVAPIIQVADLPAAIVYYSDILGFTEEFRYGEPPFYAGVKNGSVTLHLCSGSEDTERRGKGTVYIYVNDVDAYHQEISPKGVTITAALATYPYGMRDFQIKDPDGNLICFGTPIQEA